MAAYYYLRSTLPTLLSGSPPPFSSRGLLERCEGRMRPADYLVLQSALSDHPFADVASETRRSRALFRYRAWEKGLRNELTRIRAGRTGKTPERYLRSGDPEWDGIRVARAAAQCEDPLEGELLIERERWACLERLETGHFFDLEALVAYALKLRVLERKALFDSERGEGVYTAAYREILSAARTTSQADKTT
ncbi:MAG TPA: hypothetical protein VLH39_05105 [Magnetospirillaceae bacterium]|nr:hypothetical protein [Magnetospirillaceae bacterium]